MMRAGWGLFLALLLAAPVMAQQVCLHERNLVRGIELIYANGDRTFFVGDPGGLIEVSERQVDTPDVINRYTTLYGVYFLDEYRSINSVFQADGRIQTVFGMPLQNLPDPSKETRNWTATNFNLIAGRTLPREEEMTVAFGPRRRYSLGECSYEAVQISIRYDWPEDGLGQSLEFMYLVNLGFGIPLESRLDGQPRTVYRPAVLNPR